MSETCNDSCLAELIKNIYKFAYETPIPQFKEKVFQSLQPILNIDAGTWITRGQTDAHFYESDAFAYALPSGFVQEPMHLDPVNEQIQKVFQTVYSSPGSTFDILDILPEAEWFESEMYQLYCKKYQLNHSLMTVQVEPHNQVMNLVTYARNDAQHRFNNEDKQLSEWLQPCLVEGLKINLLNQFQHQNQAAYYGVFDFFGNLIEAEDGLIKLLQEQRVLNGFELTLDLLNDQTENTFEHEGLTIQAKNHQGLVLVEVIQTPLTERLSSRQLEICHHLISGKTNKEIAKAIRLSPHTIHNHLKRIFSQLKVSSRHQAIAYLMRQDLLH